VRSILYDKTHQCVVHGLNLCEVYYDMHRTYGEQPAEALIDSLMAAGLIPSEDLTRDLWRTAGRIKAVRKKVSLADCFAIALAQSLGGTVLTCDHHEFEAIATAGDCAVTFIR
jgi:predicted nucleic acid-binding protein